MKTILAILVTLLCLLPLQAQQYGVKHGHTGNAAGSAGNSSNIVKAAVGQSVQGISLNILNRAYSGFWHIYPRTLVGIGDLPLNTIREFELFQNYPNPFNPTTRIRYAVPTRENVRLEIYNILGQRVAVLVNEVRSPGIYTVDFNASNLASGLYIYRMQAGSFNSIQKMMLTK